jgi:hypothetical protein
MTYERPAGTYAGAGGLANRTKYQTDSAANTAISSAKVDGDINYVVDALNTLDAAVTAAALADGDKGDVTVSASGATWTIDNNAVTTAKINDSAVTTAKINDDAVTYAKLQNVSATSRVLGRKTASAGNAEECTLSEVLDMIGSAAQGDILYRDASGWARLGAGTSGHFLKTQGAAANPTWASASGTTYTSAEVTVAAADTGTITHNLGSTTVDVAMYLVCKSSEIGYTTNDEIGPFYQTTMINGDRSWAARSSSSNAIAYGIGGAGLYLINPSTGGSSAITAGSWRAKFVVKTR